MANPWWLIEYNEQPDADAGLAPGTSQKELYQIFQGTQAQAQAKADEAVNGGLAGPYASKAAAIAAMDAAEKSGVAPSGSKPESSGLTNTEGLGGVSNPLDWLQSLGAIADDIGKAGAWFGKKSNWIRVTKVGLGVILIISGVTHLTKGESAVVNTIGKVAGAAALA